MTDTHFFCCDEIQGKLYMEGFGPDRLKWWKTKGGYKFCPFCGSCLKRYG